MECNSSQHLLEEYALNVITGASNDGIQNNTLKKNSMKSYDKPCQNI